MKGAKIGTWLAGSRRIGLDSSVLMYHFDGNVAYRPLTGRIFNKVGSGLEAALSTMAYLELLVMPFRTGSRAAEGMSESLKSLQNFTFHPVTLEIASEGARLRAKHGLETPDAIHLATSLVAGADLFITNDSAFKAVAHREDIRIVLLDDCRE